MNKPVWAIMPILANPDYTRAAIADLLAQSVPTRLLLINQGVDDVFREELEHIAEEHVEHVLLWSHVPPLPSLAASWNLGLDLAWHAGAQEALVVNNDVRLDRDTVRILSKALFYDQALFVSAVGVTAEQFEQRPDFSTMHGLSPAFFKDDGPFISRGGPDFSCFLISRACHERFRFDERFTPAFCEDLDYHRRLLLAGEGARIFSVNLPYLHYGSSTRKTLDAPARMKLDRAIEQGSRAYYRKKWGGDVNHETFVLPFHQPEDRDVTTPGLQEMVREDRAFELPHVDPLWFGGQGNYEPTDRSEFLSGFVEAINDGVTDEEGGLDGQNS
jgi:GT2 family glycosyltransferase